MRRNILRDYLERKGGEVLSILMTEYDYATDMAVLKEEAYKDGLFVGLSTGREEGISIGLATGRKEGREEGISIGLERGLERGAYETKLETARTMISIGLPEEQIQLCTNLPLETIRDLIQPKP